LPEQENTGGSQMWRSLDELAGDEALIKSIEREFPSALEQLTDQASRREFLRVMGASLALAGLTGCIRQPEEKIIPYVRAPEEIVPGKPLYYATAMTHAGAGVGLLVESHMGRPVKVEGNPLHPAVPEIMRSANERAPATQMRFGATDSFSQASVLSLYDPDRSQTVLHSGQIDTWESFFTQLRRQLEHFDATRGRGLRLLTETVVSPTLADQLQQLLAKYPAAVWHQYEAINNDNALLGARMAFGADVCPTYDFEKADVIVSLDDDFLSEGPMHLVYARQFAERRRQATEGRMNRLYVVETSRTPTGAAADHRLPVGEHGLLSLAVAVARALKIALPEMHFAAAEQTWVDAIVDDLGKARGRSIVLAGRNHSPFVHALAHNLNATLGNVGQTVFFRKPPAARAEVHLDSLRELVRSMNAGEVEALVMIGGNPVYAASADMKFADMLRKVRFCVHLSEYADETSALCTWHVPESHFLESWSDTRAADGVVSIVQPLISPLYESKTAHEVIAALLGNPDAASHDVVYDYWRRQHETAQTAASFDSVWQKTLHDGAAIKTAGPIQNISLPNDFAAVLRQAAEKELEAHQNANIQLVFKPDPSLWDGRFANNGWLQELPKPFTKLTWDNAALIGPDFAKERQIASGDIIELKTNSASVEIPAFVVPGHPNETITLHLGYGREGAGRVGNGVGFNVYPLRTKATSWFAPIASIQKTGRTYQFATTQHHHLLEGRDLVLAGTLSDVPANHESPAFMHRGEDTNLRDTLLPTWNQDGYQWGMVVDQSSCTGCNACVVACQAENNVPVVGRDQVLRGREMHWLRIDNYYAGEPDNPTTYHQPMLCMHCEKAPCEIVCPVAATTHSSEGLNEMTYNRCVGTRYCSNNCPYKVRRFNFFDFNAELRHNATMQLRPNPDVTVRSRGVMEKCTYCVQRINKTRIESEKEDRSIRDGEIVTACQAACPSEALTFGNLNDRKSEVARKAASKLNYPLLGDLNTRPRTTYLAVVKNPHPLLAKALEHVSSRADQGS
jgi:MoCo/4Fe-4S cofactor protein with predicted Tat translocation signal